MRLASKIPFEKLVYLVLCLQYQPLKLRVAFPRIGLINLHNHFSTEVRIKVYLDD